MRFGFKQKSKTYTRNHSTAAGFALLEAMVSLAIGAALLLAFVELIQHAMKVNRAAGHRIQAEMYQREMIEVAQDLAKSNQLPSDWTAVFENPPVCATAPNTYHPEIQLNKWVLVACEEVLEGGKYKRSLSINPVCRVSLSPIGDIVACPGTEDHSTKHVMTRISWDSEFGHQTSLLESYVYRNP